MIDLLTRQEMLIDRYDSKTITALDKALNEALDIIATKLRKTENLSERQRLRTIKLLIDEELSKAYNKTDILQTDMEAVTTLAYDTMASTLATSWAAIPKTTMAALVSLDRVMLIGDKGYTISDMFQRQSDSHIARMREIINAGLAANSGYKEIIDNVAELNQTIKQRDIEAIVRTIIKQAVTNGDEYAFKKFDDVITGWQSIAVLDSRTTPVCVALSNKKYMKSAGFTYAKIPNKPPRHFRCRSKLIPLTKVSELKQQENTQSARGEERIAPAKDSFSDFFARQSAAFQEEWLGKKRYELYKQGRLKLTEFVDTKNNRLYTIDEIKAKMRL